MNDIVWHYLSDLSLRATALALLDGNFDAECP
jgi:hypothetical protein